MKPRIICLLVILLCCNMIASPNKNTGNGIQCDGHVKKQQPIAPAKRVVLMIDEIELLPIHQYLNNL